MKMYLYLNMISNCNKTIILFGGTFMKTTAEIEIEVSKGRITEAYVMPDGKCKLVIEVAALKDTCTVSTYLSDAFVKVEASKLSFEDEFMRHQPKTKAEQRLMEMIKDVIKRGPKDFWRPKYDPSFNKAGTGICYQLDMEPAVGKSYNWWEKVAQKFNSECKSRLGTKSEYIAFLAVLIKKLVKNDWAVENAWHAVCNDSKKLGHYWNSENAIKAFEPTGYRPIYGFFDLANTYKILAEDEESGGFWLASGNYDCGSNGSPLADLSHHDDRYIGIYDSCGWLVLEIGSTDH